MAALQTGSASPSLATAETTAAHQQRRKFYLFGYPIGHSLSPLLHTTVFSNLRLPWTYTLDEGTDLAAFLERLRCPDVYGSSITMPHKVAILPHLDGLTEEGRQVGACNTVFVQETVDAFTGKTTKKYIGTNTDVIGVRDALLHAVEDPASKYYSQPALVIGGGGAARSAIYAFSKYLHASSIYLVNRDASEVDTIISECNARGFADHLIHVKTAEQAAQMSAPAAVVTCVPDIAPRTPDEQAARVATDVFLAQPAKGVWLEMAYHPQIWTALAVRARDSGWQVVFGTEAMIWQGLEQDRLWTGQKVAEMCIDEVRRVVNEAVDRVNMLV